MLRAEASDPAARGEGRKRFQADLSGRSAMQQAIAQGDRGLIAALLGEPEPK